MSNEQQINEINHRLAMIKRAASPGVDDPKKAAQCVCEAIVQTVDLIQWSLKEFEKD